MFLEGLLDPLRLRQLDIPTTEGVRAYSGALLGTMKECGGRPARENVWVKERFGMRMHYPDSRVVLAYVWHAPLAFVWYWCGEERNPVGVLIPIGPLGMAGRLQIRRQGDVVVVRVPDEDAPESYRETIRLFDQSLLNQICCGLMSIPFYCQAGSLPDSADFPVGLDEFFAHLATARFVTVLDETHLESIQQVLGADDGSEDGRAARLYGDGTLVELGGGVMVDSRGRLQTEIVEGVTVRSDGKYAVSLGGGVSVDSDGVLATEIGDGMVIHTDGRLTTKLFGFDITIGQEKPKKKGFFDL